jgi:hypothetical protein
MLGGGDNRPILNQLNGRGFPGWNEDCIAYRAKFEDDSGRRGCGVPKALLASLSCNDNGRRIQMKRLTLALLCGAACLASASFAYAQQFQPKGYYGVRPATQMYEEPDAIRQGLVTVTPLPSFDYTVTASADRGGAVYSGTIIGRDPHNRGKTTTTIPTQLIPLIITINDGSTTHTYNPTIADSCASGQTDVNIVTNSPIFTTTTAWTMNGVSIGTTQYIDAFQRAEFWSLVQGTPYHLILNRTTLSSVALSFSPSGSPGTNYPASEFGGCATGFVGVVNYTDMDNMIQALITGPLAPMVNAGTFPIFLTQDVVMADPGHSIFANCCILGYHGAFFSGPNLQIYSPFAIDTANVFGAPDVEILSHEMGEAINDPNGLNPTPLWGHIGQQPNCQNNFEVGDPLTGSASPFVVGGYHLQELAFFSWFYGGPSLGSGGKFSDNNTFGGDAKACPPGGTN